MQDLKKQLGQLFIVGYQGINPKPEFLEFLSEYELGGVILFGDNCTDPERLKETLLTLGDLVPTSPPLFVAIDQEGGRVCRLSEKPGWFDSASSYADNDDLDGFTNDYSQSVDYMWNLGINFNLAPVADIFLNLDNSCMTDRCYGQNPLTVARFVERAVELSRAGNMLSCLKHFPGLGAASIDPHQAVSMADYDRTTWTERERIPFAAGIQAGADMVMTTHLHLPAIDDVIATGSRIMIGDMLRRDLGFEGVVITDELAMLGAEAMGDIGQRTVASILAGHDIVLFGPNLDNARKAYEAVEQAVSEGVLSSQLINSALKRVADTKQRLKSSKAV